MGLARGWLARRMGRLARRMEWLGLARCRARFWSWRWSWLWALRTCRPVLRLRLWLWQPVWVRVRVHRPLQLFSGILRHLLRRGLVITGSGSWSARSHPPGLRADHLASRPKARSRQPLRVLSHHGFVR